MKKKGIFIFGGCLILLGIDLFVKMYTHQNIAPMYFSFPVYPYGGIPVFKDWLGIDFSLNYTMNKGAAWGIFSHFQHALLWARFSIVIALFVYLFVAKISFSRKAAFACIATGAVGNIIDFFLYGHVVDMFHFCFGRYSFPVFNVADTLIFCGVAFLLLKSSFEKSGSSPCKVR